MNPADLEAEVSFLCEFSVMDCFVPEGCEEELWDCDWLVIGRNIGLDRGAIDGKDESCSRSISALPLILQTSVRGLS